MAYGFNSNVEFGGQIFHVQTESCLRPSPAIDTTVFFSGSVHHSVRTPVAPGEDDAAVEQQLRKQHASVIQQLKSGELRGRGPALELDWENAEDGPQGGELRLRLRVTSQRQPARGSKLIAMLRADSDDSAPKLFVQTKADTQGAGELLLKLPEDVEHLVLLVQAEHGLSMRTRKYVLSDIRRLPRRLRADKQ